MDNLYDRAMSCAKTDWQKKAVAAMLEEPGLPLRMRPYERTDYLNPLIRVLACKGIAVSVRKVGKEHFYYIKKAD
jgi:hypothetical protein